jgi:Flp pilus assembly protein TadD
VLSQLGPRGEEEAMILKGQARLRRGEFSAARARFQMAARAFPQSLRVRQLLSDAFLQEALEDFGAERALRSVLELDPENAKAKQNLGVLLSKKR